MVLGLPKLIYKSTVWNLSHVFSLRNDLTKHDQILGQLIEADLISLNLGCLRAKYVSSDEHNASDIAGTQYMDEWKKKQINKKYLNVLYH